MASNPRILIAEDESGIADTLQYVLRTDGFVPVWCPTAQEAIAQIVPRGRDVGPRVEVTFDIDGTTWRLSKQFVRKAEVALHRLEKGFIVEVVLCVPVVFKLAARRDLQTALAKALCLVKLGGLDVTDKWIPRFSMITEPEAGAEWVLKSLNKEIKVSKTCLGPWQIVSVS